MAIKYKPGQLNPVFTDPGGAQMGDPFRVGGYASATPVNDITAWGQDLAARVKAGDPAALREVQDLVRADKDTLTNDRRNLARKVSNTYLGTDYLTPYDDSSILSDLAPGLALMGGIAGLGLLAPAAAGGGAAAGAGGFGTAGMAGAGAGGGILAAPSTAFLGAANAGAAQAAGGAGAAGLGGLGAAKGLLGGLKDIAPGVLGGLGVIQAGQQYGQANDLRQQAINMARKDYAGRAPLRDAFASGALAPLPSRPDLSSMLQTTNPYQRPVPR